jgi:hypothetical protein
VLGRLKKKTLLRLAISIWRHAESQGPEMASGAGRLLLLPGLGKSHHTLWQVPEQVSGLWKNRVLMSKHMYAFLFSTYLHSPKKIAELTFWVNLIHLIH